MTDQNGAGRGTATDELRRMLDERGVPWKDYGYENHTWWGEWHAENRPSVNGLFLKVEGVVTPEQAIAATLGQGTCHDVGRYCFTCSECGHTTSEPHHMFNRNDPNVMPIFCPNCGRKVVTNG